MAELNHEAPPPVPPRRRFLTWLWTALGAAAAAEIGWLTTGFLRPRPAIEDEQDRILVLGPVEAFTPGSVTAFPAGRFYLVRLENGGFLALNRECTHLGCTVPWSAASARFDCPCHASSFAIDGSVLGPPATRPLDTHPVRIENGLVKVDVATRRRRSSDDPLPVVFA